jgi:nucleoside-diphosphate-sugar epimerase
LLAKRGIRETSHKVEQIPESDVVIHLAARVHQMKDKSQDPLTEFRKVNVDFAVDVAKQALKKGVKKFIFISSVKVYGENAGSFDENSPLNATEPYGISKLEAEQKLKELFKDYPESQLIVLRLAMVYGPGNKGNMLPLLKAAKRKLPLPLSAAKNKRSFLYVGNLVSAIDKIIKSPTNQLTNSTICNLTDNQDISSKDLYRLISQESAERNGLFYVPQFIFNLLSFLKPIKAIKIRLFDIYQFDSAKFQKTYNWKPEFSVEQGIQETVKWYLSK